METEKKLQVEKEWKTPELIVLVRSKPEEAVLAACKENVLLGANGFFSACTQQLLYGTVCAGECAVWRIS